MPPSRLQSVGVALAVLTIVHAAYDPSFNLTVNPASVNECGQVEFSWSGGVPPYTITAVHFASIIQVPAASSRDGTGSYKWICSYPKYNGMAKKDQTIFFYMTDSRGQWTLATPLYTIGDPASGMSCSYTEGPKPPWYFSLLPEGTADEFKQCDQLTIDWSSTPTNHTPVTVVGAVPNSSLIFKTSANDIKQLNWNVNVQAGADFVLAAWDSEEAQGGVTQVIRILPNENTSCLDANTLNTTAPVLNNAEGNSSKLSTGVLAGIIAGSAVAGLLLAIVAFMLVLRRRKRHRSTGRIDLNEESDPQVRVSPFSMPPDGGYTAVPRHDTSLALAPSRSGSAMPLRSSVSTQPSMQVRSSVSTQPSMQLRSSFSTQPSMQLSEMQTTGGLTPTLPTSRTSEGSRTSGQWSPLSPYTELPPGAALPPGAGLPTGAALPRPLMGGPRRSQGKGGFHSTDLYLSDGSPSDPADASTAPPNTQYRFHEDGGRIGRARAPPVVDMPPLYNAAWQEEPEQMHSPSSSPPIPTPSPTSLPTLSPPAQSLPVHMLSVQSPSVQSLSAKSSGQSHSAASG